VPGLDDVGLTLGDLLLRAYSIVSDDGAERGDVSGALRVRTMLVIKIQSSARGSR
jgi:hypothetical protein